MDVLSLVIGGAALYGGAKVLGILPSTPAAAAGAPPAGTAPVPAGQGAGAPAAAPAIPGHVFPVAPDPVANSAMTSFLGRIDAIAKKGGYSSGAGFIPRVGQDGRWYDGFGQLYQFRDCSGNPTGQPGYMSLEYQRFLDGGVNCDGTPIAQPPTGGGLSSGAQTAIQVGTTAAVAAGSAAAGGSGAAAAVAAGAAAALAALGPVPPSGEEDKDGWSKHEVHTLRRTEGGRSLGVNVFRAFPGDYLVAAVEVEAGVAAAMLWAPAAGLASAYDDHAHRVVGRFDTLQEACAAATNFAREWSEAQRAGAKTEPCPCPELDDGRGFFHDARAELAPA